MTNSKQWSSATPGHIVLMLDQSGSMSNSYGATGLSKAAFAAQTLNNLIYELIIANSSGQTVKNRVFITIIGYSGDAKEIQSGSLEDFYNTILRL
ncbi:MAG: hypothetical protein LBR34_04430, partial [Prevotella sp.]|nr:hypothetical protein [Prevotella sp.]